MTDVIDPKQVDELSEALRLTKTSKEDALARATTENQKLRDELIGHREGWYTRYLATLDRATKAERLLREAETALEEIVNGSRYMAIEKARAALVRIKELLPP